MVAEAAPRVPFLSARRRGGGAATDAGAAADATAAYREGEDSVVRTGAFARRVGRRFEMLPVLPLLFSQARAFLRTSRSFIAD